MIERQNKVTKALSWEESTKGPEKSTNDRTKLSKQKGTSPLKVVSLLRKTTLVQGSGARTAEVLAELDYLVDH